MTLVLIALAISVFLIFAGDKLCAAQKAEGGLVFTFLMIIPGVIGLVISLIALCVVLIL